MKTLRFAMGMVVVGLAFQARAAEEPAWKIEGKCVSADSCGVLCPCIFGMPPHHGQCDFLDVLHIEKGRYGSVSLDNTSLALAGRFTREKQGDPEKFAFVAYYIDSGATAAQKEALRKLLASPSLAELGKPAEVKEVPIRWSDLDNFARPDKTCGATVGDVGAVHVTPISGADKDKPIGVNNPSDPMNTWTALGKASKSFYKGAGRNYDFEGKSGESSKFSMSGGGEK